jgi:hypothetical protein
MPARQDEATPFPWRPICAALAIGLIIGVFIGMLFGG